jgi:hypothetical protein
VKQGRGVSFPLRRQWVYASKEFASGGVMSGGVKNQNGVPEYQNGFETSRFYAFAIPAYTSPSAGGNVNC